MDHWLGSAVIAAVIAASFSTFTSWRSRAWELNRWYAQFFLTHKLETLRTLHAALVDSHYALNLHANKEPQTLAEFQKHVEAPMERFFQAFVHAHIYLDDAASQDMSNVLGALRQMRTALWLRLPDSELPSGVNRAAYGDDEHPDWPLFSQSFDAAEARLATLLSPEKILAALGKNFHVPPVVRAPRNRRT